MASVSIEELDVKTPSLDQIVGNLSGGNQQKVSIAKWLAADADILIFDEPTIGIDIMTKDALHELMWNLAGSGKAILLISSDMPEMVRLADRILIMKEGRIETEMENSRDYQEMSESIMHVLAWVPHQASSSRRRLRRLTPIRPKASPTRRCYMSTPVTCAA